MRTQPWFFSRPRLWGLLGGLTLVVAQFFTPAGVGTAQAAPVCTTSGIFVTCTYTYTGAAETFTVPADVASVRIVARGAAGAQGKFNFSTDALGGRGAEVSADLAVSPNQSLVLVVGGAPTTGDCYPGIRCIGGFNGGGTSYFGGGGGGASDVRVGGNGLAQRVLVAAGGGGGGNSFYCDNLVAGGNGGNAGSAGSAGQGCRGIGGGSGGQPGSQSAGGAGGTPDGGNGTLGSGGNGGGGIGGSGGGGYYGGGGGGDMEFTPDFEELTAAGGGGGGSNLVPNGGTAGLTTQPAAIIVSYTLPDTAPPTANPSQSPAANPAGWNSRDVVVTWNWSDNGIIDTANCTTSSTSSGEGTITLSATCKDVAGNTGSATYQVKVDKTAPIVTITGVSGGATYVLGSVPTAGCSTIDTPSGVATPATLTLSGGNGDGTGIFEVTCNGALDYAGNSAGRGFSYTVIPPPDTTAPVITPNVVGTLVNNGWYISDVTVSWSVVDNESTISSQSGCDPVTVNADTPGVTFTCSATSSGGTDSQSVTIKRDATAPTISAAATTQPNGTGWYKSNVTVQFTCNDNLSGVVSCPADQILSSEGNAVSSTAQTITDQAGNSSAASNVVTVQLDKTAPVVTVTDVSDGASYTLGSVPTATCSTTDGVSGVATQATLSVTGGNPDGTGSFTATCSGATDNAGNSATASSVTYTVVDACTTLGLLDNFNRANGSLGSNWAGATGQSFYKVATNRVDVQLGGPVVWKPTTHGVNQAAFVTLSTLDSFSPAQGVLLKVQTGAIPNAGAIAVVYDNLAKAVRVSTLRLNTPAWTTYGNIPATFVNGDQLLGCVQADGTVRVYRNNSLLTTVTLNAADQSFFNAKGGKIGLWTVAAFNLFVDDFGGGALTGVSAATLGATAVPDELADDGAEITVAEGFPTDVAAPTTPDAGVLVNRAFLPLVDR